MASGKFVGSATLDMDVRQEFYDKIEKPDAPYEVFRTAYEDVLRPALRVAALRNDAFVLDLQNGRTATGATLRLRAVHIHMLCAGAMSECNGPRDLVVMENPSTHGFIMLDGPSNTSRLRGMVGFHLPLETLQRDVHNIALRWNLRANTMTRVGHVASRLQALDWDMFDKKFAVPALGEGKLIARVGDAEYMPPTNPDEKFALNMISNARLYRLGR